MVVGFEGAFEVVANPFVSGTNDSDSNVGSFTKNGGQYEGITLFLDEAIDLSTEDKMMSVKLYSEEAFTVLFKFETGVNGERSNEVRAEHTGSGWETLTFNFATDATKSYIDGSQGVGEAFVPTGQYNSISVFFDYEGNLNGTYYIDDIMRVTDGDGSNGGDNGGDGGSAEPTAAAPAPTAAEADVISIFSDAYANPAGVNYSPGWGQETTYEMVSFEANEVIKYANANYQGIDFGEAIDATSFTTVHIDVWSGDYTSIPFFLISQASGEKSVNLNVTPNTWTSIEIPLSEFSDQDLDLSDIFQIKFDVQPDNGGTFYIDNLYFYKNSDNGSEGDGGSDGDDGSGGDGDSDGDGGDGGGASSIVNGDFETGDSTGWIFFDATTTNGGSVSVSDAESNGGAYSTKITSGQFNNPGIKQERFGAGTISPNTEYQIQLDSKVESLVDGAVVNVLAFSESAVEGEAAVLHNLGTIDVAPGSWNTNTYTFTTAGTVSGGVSLLIEVVCGGATTCNGVVYIDNVTLSN
jgi:hypothetical protein